MTRKKLTRIDCIICCDNIFVKHIVTCPFCFDQACKKCWIMYFKMIPNENPKCIFEKCKVMFNSITLYKTFGICFMEKEFKTLKKQMLFSIQESLFAKTMSIVDIYRKNKQINIHIKTIDSKKNKYLLEYKDLETQYNNVNSSLVNLTLSNIKDDSSNRDLSFSLDTKIKHVQSILDDFKLQIKNEKLKIIPLGFKTLLEPIDREYFKCPSGICNGRIYNQDSFCKICKLDICTICQSIKTNPHLCNKADIESIKLKKKECKSCPKCNISIYKISGCDQMYCTECKTAFSWNTGVIEKGFMHNPHYFQDLDNRVIQRQIQDDDNQDNFPCGKLTQNFTVLEIIGKIKKTNPDKTSLEYILDIFTKSLEFENTIRGNVNDCEDKNLLLYRIQYMCNEIDKDEYTRLLYKIDKIGTRKNETNYILDMFCNSFNDLLKNYLQSSDFNTFKTQNIVLINYTKDILSELYNTIGTIGKGFLVTF
jgi:hypothetical protein